MSEVVQVVEWHCQVCTFINNSSTLKCSMCGVNKGVTIEKIDVNQNSLNAIENSDFMKLRSVYENYLELAELEATDLITCLDHFECPICLTTCSPGEGVTLKDCLHTFCRDCLAQTVEYSTETEIGCPYLIDDHLCNVPLQEREIRALVSTEIYDKFLSRSVTQAEQKIQNAFHCKTVNCKGWCIFDETVDIFQCPICYQSNCLNCQAIHPNLTCDQYRLSVNLSECDKASAKHLTKLVESKKAMSCPTCKIIITKNDGCDWMVCAVCKTEICWATRGARWGPKGRGDITGGCRCMVGGVRCHPSCQNCH